MPNSFIQGKTWYWRRGLRQLPMHSHLAPERAQQTIELFLPVADEQEKERILQELLQNGILAGSKRTRSTFDIVPSGSLIVYAGLNQEEINPAEENNIEKLKKYITDHEGKISDKHKPQQSLFRGILGRLFGHGGK